MVRSKIAMIVLLALALSVPATAAVAQSNDAPSEPKKAEDMAREGVEKLLKALDLLIKTLPQYEMPTINEQGDIIIRRKHPSDEPKPKKKAPPPDEQKRT